MTIYDVPVEDTKFFPVSGDIMRQMKAAEEKSGLEHSAKNDLETADPITQQGEQAMKNDSSIISQTTDTIEDVRDRVVLPALGEWAQYHDVAAIVREISEYDPKTGAFVITVDEERFWAIVESHAVEGA